MKKNPFGSITDEHATIDAALLPRLAKHMQHGDEGYTMRGEWGADLYDRAGSRKKLWFNGLAVIYTSEEAVTLITEKEYDPDFLRVVRLKAKNLADKDVDGFYVDDSLSGYSETQHSEDRLQYHDWNESDRKPLKVVRFALDVVSAELVEAAINYEFSLELAGNALRNHTRQH